MSGFFNSDLYSEKIHFFRQNAQKMSGYLMSIFSVEIQIIVKMLKKCLDLNVDFWCKNSNYRQNTQNIPGF